VYGLPVDDAALCAAFERIDSVRAQTSLTYFEFGTLAALDIFERSDIDVAVLEVGLGGRLDAVNMLDADAALVTSIDIDHTDWLGETRESIGREKAGICRRDRPLVISDPEPPASVLQVAADVDARVVCLTRDYDYSIEHDGWSWRHGDLQYNGLPRPALHGDFQIQNAAGVLAVLEELNDRLPVDREAIDQGLAATRLAGRLQVIEGPIDYVLDVAHNGEAARRLAGWLLDNPAEGAEHLVVGMLRDKDAEALFEPFRGRVDHWYFGAIDSPRGAEASALRAALPADRGSSQCFASVGAALSAARKAALPGDRIVVTGSFLTVADAMRILES
jgi:dihydrofolate synthase/folylpolyglutamate synthase